MRREMVFAPTLVVALLGSTIAHAAEANAGQASPAQADASEARPAQICLTPARIFSWSALDDNTIIVMARDKKHYAIKLGGICSGVRNFKVAISITTPTNVSCVGPGDRVRFGDDIFGPQACPITSITSYTPPPKPD